jgi:hypothetical protein
MLPENNPIMDSGADFPKWGLERLQTQAVRKLAGFEKSNGILNAFVDSIFAGRIKRLETAFKRRRCIVLHGG